LSFSSQSVLIVPGLYGSAHKHWQSAWERRYPHFRRVEQSDWDNPDLDSWARQVVEAAVIEPQPAVLVAHSFGCLAAVRASLFQSGLIAAALLVAPADPALFGIERRVPLSFLPFPTTVVASTNDPYLTLARARYWADRWGSQLVTLNDAGHINVQAGFDEWPMGLGLLEALCRHVRPEHRGPRRHTA
jgi:predicted alpha/beta hydrolase family esterase